MFITLLQVFEGTPLPTMPKPEPKTKRQRKPKVFSDLIWARGFAFFSGVWGVGQRTKCAATLKCILRIGTTKFLILSQSFSLR